METVTARWFPPETVVVDTVQDVAVPSDAFWTRSAVRGCCSFRTDDCCVWLLLFLGTACLGISWFGTASGSLLGSSSSAFTAEDSNSRASRRVLSNWTSGSAPPRTESFSLASRQTPKIGPWTDGVLFVVVPSVRRCASLRSVARSACAEPHETKPPSPKGVLRSAVPESSSLPALPENQN